MTIQIALALILSEDQRRVLVARRPKGVHLADYWEFPGGKVESGESAEVAAVREAREEVGLVVRITQALPTVIHTYPDRTVCLMPFVCAVDAGEAVAVSGVEVRWVTRNELDELEFPAGNATIVDSLKSLMVE
ncbi:MAG TPA: 8-oxo-dGTP diphosphatase MutT [Capsulimonadaceae bacterium]